MPDVDTTGTYFVMAFMDFGVDEGKPSLYVSSTSDTLEDVTVSTPELNQYERTFRVNIDRPGKDDLTTDVRLSGSEIQSKGVLVVSDVPVSVIGVNKGTGATDGFLCLPREALGTEYYAVTYTPDDGYPAQIAVVAAEENEVTTVTVALPKNSNTTLEYDGIVYAGGDLLTVELMWLDVLHLQADGDLTGTHIYSNLPIAVYSGHRRLAIGETNKDSADHLVTQLLPVQSWGSKFAVISLPERQNGDIIRIVAGAPSTVVYLSYLEDNYILDQAGDFLEFHLPTDSQSMVISTRPVQVVQFGQGYSAAGDVGDSTMFLVQGYNHHGNRYTFAPPDTSDEQAFNNFLLLVADEADYAEIEVNGVKVTGWESLSPIFSDTKIVRAAIGISFTDVHHPDGDVIFGAVLYGHVDREAYSLPAGLTVMTNQQVSLFYYRPAKSKGSNWLLEKWVVS